MRRAVSLLLASVALSCSNADDASGTTFPERPDCTPAPKACDVLEPDCQEAIFAATACEMGRSDAVMPPVTTGSPPTAQEQSDRVDAVQPTIEEWAFDAAYQLLGLFRTDTIREVMRRSGAGWAGSYNPRTGTVVLLERTSDPVADLFTDKEAARASEVQTLSHEFAHAIRDSLNPLEPLFDRLSTWDQDLATRTLVEGEAVAIEALVTARSNGNGPYGGVDWYGSYLARQRGVDLVSRGLFAAQTLPYAYGYWYVATALLREGTLDRFFDDPPPSMLDWLDGIDEDRSLVSPLDCNPVTPPAEYRAIFHDEFGPLGLRYGFVYDAMMDWRGDKLVVFRSPGDGFDQETAVAWTVRTWSEESAEAFLEFAKERFPDGVVRRRAQEVDVLLSTDPTVLPRWDPGCGTENELPPVIGNPLEKALEFDM